MATVHKWRGDNVSGSNGDAIASLSDEGTGASTFAQASAGAKPHLQTYASSAVYQNNYWSRRDNFAGHAALSFDGGDSMTTATFTCTQPFTMYFVLRMTSSAAVQTFLGTDAGVDPGTLPRHLALYNDGNIRAVMYNGAAVVAFAAPITLPKVTTPFIMAVEMNGANSRIILHDNTGIRYAETAWDCVDGGALTFGVLGANWAGGEAFIGHMAEVRIIEGAHDEIATIDELTATYLPPALGTRYVEPRFLTHRPLGNNWSIYAQPWRAYLETLGVQEFINGLGLAWNVVAGPRWTEAYTTAMMEHIATNGIRAARFELAWNGLAYTDDSIEEPNLSNLTWFLEQCVARDVTPIITLNSNHGFPCPYVTTTAVVTVQANVGTSQIVVDAIDPEWAVDYSGLDNYNGWDGQRAAGNPFTNINAGTKTIDLALPLPSTITASTVIAVSTLKYLPVCTTGDAHYNATGVGWKLYLHKIALVAQAVMGSNPWHIEVWNELSFGSDFLDRNKYYMTSADYFSAAPRVFPDVNGGGAVLTWVAEEIAANPSLYTSCKVSNGIANTVPGFSANTAGAPYTANGHHIYPSLRTYPGSTPAYAHINALMQNESQAGIEAFTWNLPEETITYYNPEALIGNYGPLTTNATTLGDHGRYYRVEQGLSNNVPIWQWSTELGIESVGVMPGGTSTADLWYHKAKNTLRFYVGHVGKGLEYLCIFCMEGPDTGLGQVMNSLQTYVEANGALPATIDDYTHPAMAATRRLVAVLTNGYESSIDRTNSRQLTIPSYPTDTHNNYQLFGQGTAARPRLYDRDVLFIQPFQLTSTKFVIAYYVMTYDSRDNLPEEEFTIEIGAYDGHIHRAYAYDPLLHENVDVTVVAGDADSITLRVKAVDYPRLLLMAENGDVSPVVPIPHGDRAWFDSGFRGGRPMPIRYKNWR